MNRLFINLLVFLFVSIASMGYGQSGWTWSVLPSMPEPVSNNAVTQGYCGDTLCVYSFTGIDTTKLYAGIHLKSWRYNTVSEVWTQIEEAPDVQGKIAASASTVNNRIYLIGGYHVNADHSEVSSAKVHVFDPESNQWMDDAMDIPVPIDDQVQAVWNDSLIFVVTGWSNTGNVNDVQIFSPANNTWHAGTPVPNGTFRVFGGAGAITGDSLFYYGGVTSGSFSTHRKLRKGVINPNNPLEITWTQLEDSPGAKGYRCGAIAYQDRIYFVGGSGEGYNYDGIAYSNNQGVDPLYRILTWWTEQAIWHEGLDTPFGVMDLRSLVQVSSNQWMICGGMAANQEVSDAVYLLTLDTDYGVGVNEEQVPLPLQINYRDGQLSISGETIQSNWVVKVFDPQGKEVLCQKLSSGSNVISMPVEKRYMRIISVFDHQGNMIQTKRVIQS